MNQSLRSVTVVNGVLSASVLLVLGRIPSPSQLAGSFPVFFAVSAPAFPAWYVDSVEFVTFWVAAASSLVREGLQWIVDWVAHGATAIAAVSTESTLVLTSPLLFERELVLILRIEYLRGVETLEGW